MKVWPKLYHLFSHFPLTVVIPIEWRHSCRSKTCSSTWPHSLIFKEARGNGDDAGVKWLFSELSLQCERAGNRIIVTPDLLSVIWPSLSSLPFTACILGCTPTPPPFWTTWSLSLFWRKLCSGFSATSFCSGFPQPSRSFTSRCFLLYSQISAPGTETQVPTFNSSLQRQVSAWVFLCSRRVCVVCKVSLLCR